MESEKFSMKIFQVEQQGPGIAKLVNFDSKSEFSDQKYPGYDIFLSKNIAMPQNGKKMAETAIQVISMPDSNSAIQKP